MSSPTTDFAQPFREMAERIARNLGQEFGGAVLIVPPSGEAIDVVLIGSKPDIVQFWGTAKVKVEIAATEAIAAEEAKARGGFGGMRR